jgi:hypothetical protein
VADELLDSFGVIDGPRPPANTWQDNTYRRCVNQAPNLNTNPFVVTDWYTELPVDTFDGIGVAPTTDCAP